MHDVHNVCCEWLKDVYLRTSNAGQCRYCLFVAAMCPCLWAWLSTQKLTNYRSKIAVTWYEYVLWWTLEVIRFWFNLTLIFDPESYFRIFWVRNLPIIWKLLVVILTQFHTVLYVTWFYKLHKSGHISPWPSTLEAKIDGRLIIHCMATIITSPGKNWLNFGIHPPWIQIQDSFEGFFNIVR